MAAWVDPRSTAQLKAAASTDQSARAALRDQGYSVGQDSSSGPVYVEQGSGPSSPGTPVDPNAQNNADILAAFKESSGFSREQLAETKRQFDATLAQKQLEWQRQGLPELQIKQQLANLEDAKFKETVQEFQSTQGLDYLKFASTLGGSGDVFQSADFMRGAQQRGDVPTFLNALSSNTQLPSFQGVGTVPQIAQTAPGLAGQLTGAGVPGSVPGAPYTTAGGYDPNQALAAVGSIFKAGPSSLAAGALERLSPTELGIMQSGAKKLGYNWDDWAKGYTASGVGQKTATAF
jgi:hypothetical protein